jgi:hypothetical protein
MMALFQELSLLRELDGAFEANPTEAEREARHVLQHESKLD